MPRHSWPRRFRCWRSNAVLAVAIGCSIYGLKFVYVRWVRPGVGQAGWPVQHEAE